MIIIEFRNKVQLLADSDKQSAFALEKKVQGFSPHPAC